MQDKRLYLVGFIGVGKTTVGRMLGQNLQVSVIDLDEMIEADSGQTITEIFQAFGEVEFREKETEALYKLETSDFKIVSCGGGIILRDENVALMKKTGKIVYLKADVITLRKRLEKTEDRPLLEGLSEDGEKDETIRRIFMEREDRYEMVADEIVVTDGKTPKEITDEILERMK